MPFDSKRSAGFLADLIRSVPALSLPPHHFVEEGDFSAAERKLLVHSHHMTVTLESHHQGLVSVEVLKKALDGDLYTREIQLTCSGANDPVLHGLVKIRLKFCKPEVRALILEGRIPLGRILISHGVLTRIELVGLLRVDQVHGTQAWFPNHPGSAPGRLAVIHCDSQPAIELLEVVWPMPEEHHPQAAG